MQQTYSLLEIIWITLVLQTSFIVDMYSSWKLDLWVESICKVFIGKELLNIMRNHKCNNFFWLNVPICTDQAAPYAAKKWIITFIFFFYFKAPFTKKVWGLCWEIQHIFDIISFFLLRILLRSTKIQMQKHDSHLNILTISTLTKYTHLNITFT